jgi:hypothetical protein
MFLEVFVTDMLLPLLIFIGSFVIQLTLIQSVSAMCESFCYMQFNYVLVFSKTAKYEICSNQNCISWGNTVLIFIQFYENFL